MALMLSSTSSLLPTFAPQSSSGASSRGLAACVAGRGTWACLREREESTWHATPATPARTHAEPFRACTVESPVISSSSQGPASGSELLLAEEGSVGSGVRALRAAEVVAVPTDTIYGLAADARIGSAVDRIYEMKGRNRMKPMAVCVADLVQVPQVADVAHLPIGLLPSLLPGPVTLIFPHARGTQVHRAVTGGGDSLGVRIPNATFIRSLARAFGAPLALTSANVSSERSTVAVEEFKELWPHCACVFDGGVLEQREGSTVVDLTKEGVYRIVRSGGALEQTEETLRLFGLVPI